MPAKTLKTEYRFIKFEQESNMYQANPIWRCKNKKQNTQLGIIEYYNHWNQWVFGYIDHQIIFNSDCMDEILHFLKQLNRR